MNNPNKKKEHIQSLIILFKSEDGMERKNARNELVLIGKPAVSALCTALKYSEFDKVRWEAAKTLGAILDAKAVPALVKALEDNETEVAWLAAEALEKLKMAAWPKLLDVLLNRGMNSLKLRNGAHHIFRNQNQEGFIDLLDTLREALASASDYQGLPLVAFEILKRMKEKDDN